MVSSCVYIITAVGNMYRIVTYEKYPLGVAHATRWAEHVLKEAHPNYTGSYDDLCAELAEEDARINNMPFGFGLEWDAHTADVVSACAIILYGGRG